MCLSDVVRLERVGPDGVHGVGLADGRRIPVSLAVLLLDGVTVTPGDWLVVHSGLAVEKVSEAEAAAVSTARTGMREPGAPTRIQEGRHEHPGT